MPKPITDAVKEYGRLFEQQLGNYLIHGYVYSGDDAFIMARPIEKKHADKFDDFNFKHQKPDCWFVFYASGRNKIKRFQELAPYKLKYVAWHRLFGDTLKIYDWHYFRRKTIHGNNSKSRKA
jgi:hypothetical protein